MKEDLSEVTKKSYYYGLRIMAVDRFLTMALVQENDYSKKYMWDLTKGQVYQFREDMYFLQHSEFKGPNSQNYNLFFFEVESTLKCLSFSDQG